jgi:hypothetical protein
MSNIKVVSQTQRIIVNPATSSISVINAGPPGPSGIAGPRNVQFVSATAPTAISVGDQWFNILNGRQYVWYDGFWVEIGTSFQGSGLTADGNLPTRVAGDPGEITRANLALDVAFTSKYTQVINHGSTAATARAGTAPCFWIGSVDPTNAVNNDRLYRTDTTAYYVRVAGAWVESGSTRYVPVATTWTGLAYSSPWADVSGRAVQHRTEGNRIFLRGTATRPSGTNAPIGTLPVGSRPFTGRLEQFSQKWWNGSVDAIAGIQIADTGVITVGGAAASGTIIELTMACSFSTVA